MFIKGCLQPLLGSLQPLFGSTHVHGQGRVVLCALCVCSEKWPLPPLQASLLLSVTPSSFLVTSNTQVLLLFPKCVLPFTMLLFFAFFFGLFGPVPRAYGSS